MGRKRKSEIFEQETTPVMKVALSPESRRSSRLQDKQKIKQDVVVLVDLADGEKKQPPNESETENNVEKGSLQAPNEGKPSNGEVAETNVEQGASKVPEMKNVSTVDGLNVEEDVSVVPGVNSELVITEKNVEHGSSQVPLLNTELAVAKTMTVEKLNSAVQRIKELKSKGGMSPDAGPSDDICYKSLYMDAQEKMEELMEDNITLKNQLSFEKGRVEAYMEMKDEMINLLKGAISSPIKANETQPAKKKYNPKKGSDKSRRGKANETQPSKQKDTKKGNDKS